MSQLNCKTIGELLPLYVEGKLQDKKVQELKDHLKNCPECKGKLKNVEKLDEITAKAQNLHGSLEHHRARVKKLRNRIFMGMIVIVGLTYSFLWFF